MPQDINTPDSLNYLKNLSFQGRPADIDPNQLYLSNVLSYLKREYSNPSEMNKVRDAVTYQERMNKLHDYLLRMNKNYGTHSRTLKNYGSKTIEGPQDTWVPSPNSIGWNRQI